MARTSNCGRAMRIAATLGATVECGAVGSLYTIMIDAPLGHAWIDGGCFAMRIEGRGATHQHREEMWQDAIDRMRCGLMEAEEDE